MIILRAVVLVLERAQDKAMDVACSTRRPLVRRAALAWAGLYGWPR